VPRAEAVAARRDARRRALSMLYQADVTGTRPSDVVATWFAEGGDADVPDFARELVEGVERTLGQIDAVIARSAEGWTIDRMAAVDRTILRLAVFELFHRPETPVAVAVAEAVAAAKELSTEASGRFVNGVLGRIVREEIRERA
jgi:N utilization substance protein B